MDQNCRRYNGRRKTQDGRSSNARHRTSSSEHSLDFRRLLLWRHKLARCCWAADDSQGGIRSHANDNAACLLVRRTRWLAAATTELQLMQGMCATLIQDTRSTVKMRQVSHKSLSWRDDDGSLPGPKKAQSGPSLERGYRATQAGYSMPPAVSIFIFHSRFFQCSDEARLALH
jgi:hypothetical protein